MKLHATALFLTVLVSTALFAQKPPVEVTPLAGFNLGGATDFDEGRVDIADSFMYGFVVSVVDLPGGISVDLSYTRADSTADFTAYDTATYSDGNFDMATNYIMAGVNKDFLENNIRLFIGADIGAAWFDSKISSVSDAWFFAFDLKGGVKVYLGEHVGLRLQGRFLLPMDFSDSGFFFGVGSGGSSAGLTVGGTAVIYQGDFSAGLVIRL